ncbi:MAG: endonuclease/exonuclease/phosphatase family protein [Proteobacteria bacterium]|nr:endonuclease/exonuclease/phosphatase family protein [Pseudomonadota bacterium]
MSGRFKIGTWNLERSGAHHRGRMAGQLACLAERDCDVWVLTETHDDLRPTGYDYKVVSATNPRWQSPGEQLVAIWSRHPMMTVQTDDPCFTAAARLELPGYPRGLLVYGTVVTYAHDTASPAGQAPAPVWSRHRAAVAAQTQEWVRLRARFPADDMCIAGDFNMNLDGTRWYGVRDAREALLKGLHAAGLRCLTTENLRATRPDIGRASVDHICFSDVPGATVVVDAWSGGRGRSRLSDHNGLAVEISLL